MFLIRRIPILLLNKGESAIFQKQTAKSPFRYKHHKTTTQLMTMIMTYLILGILFIGGLSFYLTSCKSKASNDDKQTTSRQDTTSPKVDNTKTNTFNDLRGMAFSATPEQLQLSLPAENTIVYGVIMDWDIDTATATFVSYQTGDASMYLSSGGGVIGGGKHQNVNSAAKQFVNLAQKYLGKTTKTETNPLPHQDEVKFYLLTNKGTYVGQEIMRNFENNSSSWLPLFEEANKVLTELRMTTEKQN
jgi:hypothetical protein